jgi:hypothetical protein
MNYWMGTEAQFASTFGNPQPVPPAPPVVPWPSQTNRAAAVPTGGVLATRPDGGVFAYGAGFFGSMAGHPLSAPIIGIAPTKTGKGYWLVGADGGVFCFGDAAYHGSAPANPSWGIGTKLNPVVGIALDESKANGYVLIADSGAGPAPSTYYLNETTHYK